MKHHVFGEKLLVNAKASQEEMEDAKKNGVPFIFHDEIEDATISGHVLDGVVYVADIKTLNKQKGKDCEVPR